MTTPDTKKAPINSEGWACLHQGTQICPFCGEELVVLMDEEQFAITINGEWAADDAFEVFPLPCCDHDAWCGEEECAGPDEKKGGSS